jgi:hypothetical protein
MCTHRHPFGVVYHVDDAVEFGWVLNLVLRFREYLSQNSFLVTQLARGNVT